MKELIKINDGPFKQSLDRYKYSNRYETNLPAFFIGMKELIFCIFLTIFLNNKKNLFGNKK